MMCREETLLQQSWEESQRQLVDKHSFSRSLQLLHRRLSCLSFSTWNHCVLPTVAAHRGSERARDWPEIKSRCGPRPASVLSSSFLPFLVS